MGEYTQPLSNGNTVTLATWEGLQPPRHGESLLNAPWDADAKRSGLSFYDATAEYMRNTWAADHMPQATVSVGNQHVSLHFNAQTQSWHTPEALDIDHRVQWKEHLTNLGVDNKADALLAYNDVSNLRLLPSAVNRARDSADAVLGTHGQDSPQWQAWCKERFDFDPSAPRLTYDADGDLARRQQRTIQAPWTDSNTRSDLSFDKAVEGKWFDDALGQSFVQKVQVDHPTTGAKMEVPLFRCAATHQLVTRDAFDIDHQIAFESLLKVLPDHTNGNALTKANVLDAYNDTSNLRLVSRSANSSHKWELNDRHEFHESRKERPEQPGEFSGWKVGSEQMPGPERSQLDDAIQHYGQTRQHVAERTRQMEGSGVLAFQDPRAIGGPVAQLNEPTHPDYPAFKVVRDRIDQIDPQKLTLPTDEHRDNLAAFLTATAKQQGLPGIDHVEPGGKDGTRLFAVSGRLDDPANRSVSVEVTQGALTPVQHSTFAADQVAVTPQAQAQAQHVQNNKTI